MAQRYRVRDGYVWTDFKGEPQPKIREVFDTDPAFKGQIHKVEPWREVAEDREAKSPENRMMGKAQKTRKVTA